jgi:hypothetical protein
LPPVTPPDRNIASNAEEHNGIYPPSRHLKRVRDSFERAGKDPEAYVRSHVRRLEALRRSGLVERIDADHWKAEGHRRAWAGTTSARAVTG